MNNKHKKTLSLVFTKPVPKTMEWKKIESLLIAVGCKVADGDGSRVKFDYEGHTIVFHRPHPQKKAKPYVVRLAKEYLELIGVAP